MNEIYPITICPERFTIQTPRKTYTVPLAWSHPLHEINPNITRIIIIIHGVLRNADDYFPNMLAAVDRAGFGKNTLVIAPQFLVAEDLERFNLPDNFLFWGGQTGEGWKKGDDAFEKEKPEQPLPSGEKSGVGISAFDVIDRIITTITKPSIFPQLKSIIVAGHSAGGQFVNRYAAGTQITEVLPSEIQVRFVVANPSTYLYFNEDRRVGNSTNLFEPPPEAPHDYNHYKYGLEKMNRYMSIAGAHLIRQRYPVRDVFYLLGGEDTREAHLEQTPNAMLQGANRLERGQIYFHYLRHFFGDEVTKFQKIAIVPCVGHDNAAMFSSDIGINALFSL